VVAAGLGNNAYLCTRIAPDLGPGDAGLHGELLHRIGDVKVVERTVHLGIVVVHPIQREVVRLRPHARNAEPSRLCPRSLGKTARCDQRQVDEVAIKHGQSLYLIRIYTVAHGVFVGLNQRRFSLNFYDLGLGADFQF